jgi:hypothetical protein
MQPSKYKLSDKFQTEQQIKMETQQQTTIQTDTSNLSLTSEMINEPTTTSSSNTDITSIPSSDIATTYYSKIPSPPVSSTSSISDITNVHFDRTDVFKLMLTNIYDNGKQYQI